MASSEHGGWVSKVTGVPRDRVETSGFLEPGSRNQQGFLEPGSRNQQSVTSAESHH